LKNGVFVFDFHRNFRNDVLNSDVLKNQVLDLTDQLLNSGGSLSDGESVDNGDQGSANNRWRVDDNWCRIWNGRLNSGPLRFRHRRGLNLSGSLNRS
jgi:hypothetical protein